LQKQELVEMMVRLLQAELDAQSVDDGKSEEAVQASADQPLVGEHAVVTSMGLVSLIADIEESLAEEHDLNLTLVSENALSRKKSPFRSLDTLADYVLELTEAPAEESVEAGAQVG
jgi:acyl carrier protein